MKTNQAETPDYSTPDYWREKLADGKQNGMVLAVDSLSQLIERAAEHSPSPETMRALCNALFRIATLQGHGVVCVDRRVIGELMPFAFPTEGPAAPAEAGASVTPLFPQHGHHGHESGVDAFPRGA